jgi:thiamine kinase-like enzyme
MENQKNFVQHVIQNNDILPIERELIDDIKRSIELKLGAEISSIEKYSTEVLYDCYMAISGSLPLMIKVNLSPDTPNFWKELVENNFSFHPKIICASQKEDINKFICFELPKGIFLSDVSNYPLNSKFNFINFFARDIKKIHQLKLKNEDDTLQVFNGMCPFEASMIYDPFPIAQLIGSLRTLFKKNYQSNIDDCGLCHFDLCPENIIFSNKEFKFLNFEYAANANIYIDIWAAREALNVSDQSFLNFINTYEVNKTKLHSYRQAADMFVFAYFNSKIIAEYMTFGVRNHIKLKHWINKSETYYYKIAHKLFIEKKLDNTIRQFYNLWK